ncbi:MAG TPA: glycosyltransferase family 2 protein [Caldimonas sp.]|nr:glycosyltransferase family 2 protein [Caldimonas sp.]
MTGEPTRDCRIVAVLVAYRPEPELFAKVLAAIDDQVAAAIVVDNGNGAGLEQIAFDERLERIDMHGNAGVAAAQNAGIRRALSAGATHVLILDHDSVSAFGMTDKLLRATHDLEASGERVAAVGADYHDPRHPDSSPFVVMRPWGFGRVVSPTQADAVAVPFLISAGSLIGADALTDVGLMEERLFIDYIDIEWCLRARGKGWTCHGVPGARLEHRLGDAVLACGSSGRPVRIFGRTFSSRSPLRHYYMFRNGCWLVLHSALPLRWKLLETKRLVACFGVIAMFATQRRQQVRAMAKGVVHGIRGCLGPA